MEERNLDFAAALSRAVNDWQLEDVGEAGAAAARRHRGAAGGCGLRCERDRAARRRSGLRPDPDFAARQRSARPPPLLADLRGGASAAGGRSRCMCRASAAATPRPGRAGRPITCRSTTPRRPACRTRVTSLVFEGVFERFPEAQGGADRRRLRLGAGAVLAHGQALAAHAQGNSRTSSGRRRNTCASILVHHPADRGAGGSRSISPTSSTGSAGTG